MSGGRAARERQTELSRTAVACRTKRSLNAFGPNGVLNVNVNGLPVRWCTPTLTLVYPPCDTSRHTWGGAAPAHGGGLLLTSIVSMTFLH